MKTLPYELDDGVAAEGAIGLIVLQTDETLEPELRGVFAGGVSLYHSRIPCGRAVTVETLAQMRADLPAAAALLPPGCPFRAIGYGCTSGATVIGPQEVAGLVRRHHPNVPVTDPLSAVIAALSHLDARRIGFLTPYSETVTSAMRGRLEAAGFEIASMGSFAQEQDRLVARITEAAVLEGIREVGTVACDAVFVSCTNLRSLGILARAEGALGRPVVSSNLALAWHLHVLAGLDWKERAPGRLFAP
ncbi:MAG: aspartate/glutamate racemase family protein [Paracoccaceae bacterium]